GPKLPDDAGLLGLVLGDAHCFSLLLTLHTFSINHQPTMTSAFLATAGRQSKVNSQQSTVHSPQQEIGPYCRLSTVDCRLLREHDPRFDQRDLPRAHRGDLPERDDLPGGPEQSHPVAVARLDLADRDGLPFADLPDLERGERHPREGKRDVFEG